MNDVQEKEEKEKEDNEEGVENKGYRAIQRGTSAKKVEVRRVKIEMHILLKSDVSLLNQDIDDSVFSSSCCCVDVLKKNRKQQMKRAYK